MKWLVLIFILVASSVVAQPVVVKTGDHADFTRLVLTFPDAVDWQLRRSDTGYEFGRLDRQETYDLSDVYRLITKNRLKSIWVDPTSGRLQMGVDCACHAIPFEFNANTLVIDIRDGPPPKGSIFEQTFTSDAPLPPLNPTQVAAATSTTDPAPVYDWLGASDTSRATPDPSPMKSPLEAEAQADSFRSAVIGQLAKGATEGVVDISPEGLGTASENPQGEVVLNTGVTLGDQAALPQGVMVSDGADKPPLAENGSLCPAEDRVDLALWAVEGDWGEALAASRTGLMGEFDQPSAKGIDLAVRTHLFLGFGAEARNIATAFQQRTDFDPLTLGMTYLVDGERPMDAPFAGMQTCDNGAAFWALAASAPEDSLVALNGKAVARTFIGLPQHLKRVFAQSTAEGLLRANDPQNAEIVRMSLARAVPDGTALVPMVDAQMALQTGQPEKAEALLDRVSGSELASDALLALIEARFQQMLPVDEADVIALEAFGADFRGSSRETAYRRSMTHAYALAGDFRAAFDLAGNDMPLRSDAWIILARLGQASDLLTYAVGSAGGPDDQIASATRSIFAKRLVELGLPNAAQVWLPTTPEDPALTAEVALANQDGRTALRALSQDLPGADPDLLARAFQETGNFAQAAAVLRDVGGAEAAEQLERWADIWPSDTDTALTEGTSPIWRNLASLRGPKPQADDKPPLEASQAYLDESTQTRQSITDLLQAVPMVTQ